MKYILILFSLILLFGCSETPNETPIDVLRDVVFKVDMNSYIEDGFFDVVADTLLLKGDFNNWGNDLIMTESRDDGVYSIELFELIAGETYEYLYCINDSLETLDGNNREYQVLNETNNVINYYNELDPTIVIFRVDMNNADFNPDEDFVDVPGSHNDWTEGTLMTDENGDGFYELILTTIDVGTNLEYKFRINYDWATAELEGGANRTHTVVEGINERNHIFDVE
jgi:1,4-alpha-glucan branching enzyme